MNSGQLTFKGQIENRKQLIEQLELEKDCSLHQLLNAAYDKWTVTFNQHVAGDYLLTLPVNAGNELFICLSAFSSHQLFYQILDSELLISNQCKPFREKAKVNPVTVQCLLETGIIVPPLTMFTDVFQLSSGESQLWNITAKPSLLSKRTLSLKDKLNIHCDASSLALTPLANTSEAYDFNDLPKLSRLLGQPVNQPWPLIFTAQLNETTEKNLIVDAATEHLRTVTLSPLTDKLATPLRKRTGKAISALKKQWQQQYEQEMQHWSQPNQQPDFSLWFALTYKLPATWSQMRIIAESTGKTIKFSYTNPALAVQLLQHSAPHKRYSPLFGFDLPSIKNPYDAIQRLMWHGNKSVTHQLFKLVPPFTAGLIKKHPKHPEQVDSFCFHSLTLDHLAQQYQWSLT